MEDAAGMVGLVGVRAGDAHRVGDSRRQWAQRSGILNVLMWPMAVVEAFDFAQGVR
jgi:hypothetical protein